MPQKQEARHRALELKRYEILRQIRQEKGEPDDYGSPFAFFQQKLHELRTFALQRLSNIRFLLGKTDAIREARALLAEQFGKFALNRVKDAGGWSYKAEGSVNFFGESLIRVDGAGGRNWTESLPVPFGWLARAAA